MNFKKIVRQIRELPWQTLDGRELQRLMFISRVYAVEFAEALRIALREYPDNAGLLQMARGELDTNNLRFGNYTRAGDHADFLGHFLAHNGIDGDALLERHASEYLQACRALSAPVRAMSVFSREEELSGIFREILQAPDWSAAGLEAFHCGVSADHRAAVGRAVAAANDGPLSHAAAPHQTGAARRTDRAGP